MMTLFLVLFLFLPFVPSLSSLTGVFISPAAWLRFILTAISCGFSFFVCFIFCLCTFSLSAALYGFAALLKMLTSGALFEAEFYTFPQVFSDVGWMVAFTVDIVDSAVWFFIWLIGL